MELLKVESLDRAVDLLVEHTRALPGFINTEVVPVEESLGRILAKDVTSGINIPSFERTTVDGFAVRATDTHGASESIPAFLDLVEEVDMGQEPKKALTPGTCSYVPTGGMIPRGADAMVMVEYTEKFTEDSIAIMSSSAVGQHVVRIGEDVKQGEILLKSGTTMNPACIGTACAAGIRSVEVYRPLRVFIFSTGDEVVPAGGVLTPGKVYDINTPALKAAAQSLGMEIMGTAILKDDHQVIRGQVSEAMKSADIILTSGGSSKGKKDMTSLIFGELCDQGVFVHGLAVKPGKPTILAADGRTGTLMIGLPGHPGAALMVFGQLMEGFLAQMMGRKNRAMTYAVMSENMAAAPGRSTLQLVELQDNGTEMVAIPILGKSGMISPMTRADGYIKLDRNSEGIKAGARVAIYPLFGGK